MAIKGKSKSRGARTVARGPKPVYTPVRRPLLQRRGFWLGVLVAVVVVAIAGLTYGFVHQRSQDRAAEATQVKATVMRRYSNEVDPILETVGQPVQGTQFRAFTELTTTLSGLTKGGTDPAAATATATEIASSAKTAGAAIENIDAAKIVAGKTDDPAFVQYVTSSKDELAAAMRLYEQVAELTKEAATAPDDLRPQLLTRAQALLGLAADALNRGYDSYVQAQTIAGTFQPTFGASGLTGLGATGIRPTGSSGTATGATATTGAARSTGASGATANG
jgi:hypothetical protein